MADEKKKKKKSDISVDFGGTVEVVSEHSSMKKEKTKKKKKNREIKDDFSGDHGERESEQLGEDALVKKKKSKKQRVDSEAEEAVKKKKSKKKNKEAKVEPEAEDGGTKSKKKIKERDVDSEAEDGVKKKKKGKKESGSDVIGNSESSNVCEKPLVHTGDSNKKKGKRKREDTDLGAEENTDKEMKRKSKKKKLSVDSEVEETSLNSTNGAKKKSKEENTSEDTEVKENKKNSSKDSKKGKKKEKKQSVDSEVEDNNLNSTKDVIKKTKEKRVSEDSEVEENNKDSTKDGETKQSVDSEAEENGLNSTKDAKKKRKKKQESGKSDKEMTTPSSTSTKRVKFSDQVEFFPAEDEETEEEDDAEEVKVVRGKRFTKEEDELVKNAVLEYIDNHALGDEGIKMVMECKSHKQLKGCWKEIASALPWRTHESVYHRAHTVFEAGSQGVWTKEDMELIIEFQKKHGNDWKTLADAMGKHRKHVKDAWRRMRLASKNRGHWTREEYQSLFDLVNKDLRTKAFQEKYERHGMLRDNIPWSAISDVLQTRDHVTCCQKWYEQLTSPMVAKGIWDNVDDYKLLEELLKLDAACIDDVDWDYILENRDGEACRKRWNQMVLHVGVPKSKTFAEQVEILSNRYCPDIAEHREDFDNRPYDPED